jgi:hypothetical protein
MELYILFFTVLAFLVFTFKREQDWKEERQDLFNRIMSKDVAEYKEITSEPVSFEPVTVSEEKEYWMEIEEQKR